MSEETVIEYRRVLDGLGDKVAEPDPFADQISAAWELHLNGKNQQSLESFDAILRQNKAHMDALFGKGLALKGLGRDDEAVATFQEVIQLLDTIREDMPGRSIMLERLCLRQIKWVQEGV